MTSIRRYLNWALATLLLVVMSLAVTAAYFVTRHEMEEIFDAQLSLQGRIVAGLVTERSTADEYARIAAQLSQPGHFARWYGSTGNLLTDLAAPVLYDHEEKMISLGVWSDSGRPILMGARWHDDADGTSFPAPHHEAHRWVSYQDHRWRTFSMPIAGGRWLSIGLRDAFQSELFNKVALGNFVPLLLTLAAVLLLPGPALLAGLLWLGYLAWGVRCLAWLRRRAPGDVPRAVVGLIAAISLFDAVLIAALGHPLLALLAASAWAATLQLQRLSAGT